MNSWAFAAEPVSSYDAKTHLPRLLQQVERGQRFVITRHGRPVAQLVPITERNDASLREAVARIRARRTRLEKKGVRLSDILEPGESLRDLAHAGHRY